MLCQNTKKRKTINSNWKSKKKSRIIAERKFKTALPWKYLPDTCHYNPLLIWNRSCLWVHSWEKFQNTAKDDVQKYVLGCSNVAKANAYSSQKKGLKFNSVSWWKASRCIFHVLLIQTTLHYKPQLL